MTDIIERVEIEESDSVEVEKFTPYDPADDLISDEGIAYFMEEALKTNDPEFIAHALATAARAKGMMNIAKEAGLARERLSLSYRGKDEATLLETLAAMKALGIGVATKVIEQSHA